jgi:hypothetical protein
MFNSLRRWVILAVAVVVVGGMVASVSQAAPPTRVIVRPVVTAPVITPRLGPTIVVTPTLPVPQYTYNPNVLGRGYSNVLANNANVLYTAQYNAYLSSLYATPYVYPNYYSAYTPFLYNPYMYSPYATNPFGLYP